MPSTPLSLPSRAVLAQWFAARSVSERRMLRIAAIVLAVAGAVTLLEWSAAERERTAHRLPAARAELLRMQQDAAELARLRQLPGGTPPPEHSLASAAEASARAQGLELNFERDADGFVARGSATLPALVEWLAAIHTDLGLRPTRLQMNSGTPAGVEVRFASAAARP